MDFFGIGAGELILIFILLFTVAGPKRMIQWAYVLGKYVAQFRRMFDETMGAIKKELQVEDLDISKDLKIPNTRYDVVREANKFINDEVNRPVMKGSANASTAAKPAAVTDDAQPDAPIGPSLPPTDAPPSQPPAAPANDGADGENSRYDAWLPN